ncbi:MAG: NifU family protein [Planctomycetota bacterium]|jgi:Fe-S cluster biogenesis protein NfuA
MTPCPSEPPVSDTAEMSLRDRVQAILNLIRPAIQSDGGDLELVDVREDGTVLVRFHGACVGCPSSSITLQVGIERQLKDRIPEVTAVETVQ